MSAAWHWAAPARAAAVSELADDQLGVGRVMDAYILNAKAYQASRPSRGEVLSECFAAEHRGVAEWCHRVPHVGFFGLELGQLVDLVAIAVLQPASALEHGTEYVFGGSHHGYRF